MAERDTESSPQSLTRSLFSVEGKEIEFLQWVFGYICSTWSMLSELDGELVEIRKTKERIEALLKDGDERRKIEDETVMQWLGELSGLALDAADLLELVSTRKQDRSRQQQTASPTAPTAPNRNKRKRTWSSLWHTAYQCSSSVPFILFRWLLAKEAKSITSQLDDITQRKKKLRLQPADATRVSTATEPPTTAALPVEFVGMISDKQTIISLLLQDNPQSSTTRVVAITGMGGSGKTATAQSVCDSKEVTAFFNKTVWVDVKRDHGAERIVSEILDSLGERSRFCNFNTSLRRLKELLVSKKVLVVLDNTEDGFLPSWASMHRALCAPGCKVLVTTTNNEVARDMGAITHQLTGLSENEWLQLFMSKTGNLGGHPHLHDLAREIGRSCEFSPFAAKSLGSLMSCSRDVREWENVVHGETRQGTPRRGGNGIQQMLRRSYEFLPLHQKRCFAFCAIFPDDHDLDMNELAKMWVALGFIPGDHHSPEAVGRRLFRNLEAKSFFEVSTHSKTLTEQKGCYYKIPKLMKDLARSISDHECLNIGTQSGDENHGAISENVRHLLLNCSPPGTETGVLGSSLEQADHRRTFIMRQCLSALPGDLFLKMPCLRVLDLSCTAVYNLPESIGELELLRYLNLFNTNIAKLPDSVASLRNLQTLNLGDCYFLHALPQETSNLTDLRHLSLRLTHPRRSSLASMPPNIGKLTRLQTLSRFIVGERSQGRGIDQLQHLQDIDGEFWLSKLENVEDADDARNAHLAGKKHIDALTLEWTVPLEVAPENHSNIYQDVIEQLHPHPYLKYLRIDGFYGDAPPKWIPKLTNLRSVCISHCQFQEPLTVLEMLPRLRDVQLEQLGRVTAMIPSGSPRQLFVSLETVTLRNMTNLEVWSFNHDKMPSLKVLCFCNCPKLADPRSLFPPYVDVQIKH